MALQMYLGPSFGGDKAAGETGRAIGSILSLELMNAANYRDQMAAPVRLLGHKATKLVACFATNNLPYM